MSQAALHWVSNLTSQMLTAGNIVLKSGFLDWVFAKTKHAISLALFHIMKKGRLFSVLSYFNYISLL